MPLRPSVLSTLPSTFPTLVASCSTASCSSARLLHVSAPVYWSNTKTQKRVKVQKDNGGYSSMGLKRFEAQGSVTPEMENQRETERLRSIPAVDGGTLNQDNMRRLVSLYHQTRTHVSRSNLEEILDAEFTTLDVESTEPSRLDLVDLVDRVTSTTITSSPRRPNLAIMPVINNSMGPRELSRAKYRQKDEDEREKMLLDAAFGTEAGGRPALEILLEETEMSKRMEAEERREMKANGDEEDGVQGERPVA